MTEITEYYSSGKSLKAVDIEGDELDVVIEGWRDHTFDDGKKTLFLTLAGLEKEFRVNYTNGGRIAEMYGKRIEDWIGKPLTLMPDKTKGPSGNIVDTIVVRVRKTARNAPKKYDEQNPPPRDDDAESDIGGGLDDSIPF